jgi:transposase-like protein
LKIGEDELAEVIERYSRGETIVQIAHHFGVNRETVRRALLRSRVRPRARGRASRLRTPKDA